MWVTLPIPHQAFGDCETRTCFRLTMWKHIMDPAQTLISKFERFLVLTDAERQAVIDLPMRVEEFSADQAILREGARPKRSALLLDGLCCNSKVGANGRRQILAFYIPEDAPDLISLHLEVLDSDTWAITPCTLAFTDHGDLNRFCDAHPRLARFLWRSTLVDASIHREWTMNVGLRDGKSRMAHVLCEILTRMDAIGRAQNGTCAFRVTQEDLAEATGMSKVHAGRVLQDLRREGLFTLDKGQLTVHDFDRLMEVADFRTEYLHLPTALAA